MVAVEAAACEGCSYYMRLLLLLELRLPTDTIATTQEQIHVHG